MMKNIKIVSSVKIHPKIRQQIYIAYKKCSNFFECECKESFSVIVCNTREEFKKESKYYYVPYATALVLRNKNIVIKSPDLIEAEGKWHKSDFSDLLSHEMSHSFWYSILGVWTPTWLSEGVACNIGKQYFLTKNKLKALLSRKEVNISFIDFRYLPKKIGKLTTERYQIWSNFTKFLINIYGKRKILLFIKRYSSNTSKSNYESIIVDIYKKSTKELFREFCNSL